MDVMVRANLIVRGDLINFGKSTFNETYYKAYDIEEYVNFLRSNFCLNKNGEIINYFYRMDGKLKSNKNGSSGEENAEEMVYVGRNMGRYHKKRDCHYISNTYQTVSIAEATAMRDADGHRFTACSSCKGMIGKSGMVYVTPGGRHYHGSTDCSAMVSYVRKVPISEVLYLGVCSYCGGK